MSPLLAVWFELLVTVGTLGIVGASIYGILWAFYALAERRASKELEAWIGRTLEAADLGETNWSAHAEHWDAGRTPDPVELEEMRGPSAYAELVEDYDREFPPEDPQ